MITKLTAEQEKQIPKFIEKWVNQASVPMNHKKAIEYTKKLYKAMGQDEPIIIFGFSPMNTVLLASLFFCLVKDKKSFSQLDSQLRLQLDSQLGSQLRSQLDSQLDSQLCSQLGSQLGSQLCSQLYSQLYSQLDSQLCSQLYSQLGLQLYSQLGSQLYSQLDSQLGSQLYSQLGSQLRSQLDSQLRLQLRSQLRLQLYSQLCSQLCSQLGSQLRLQLYSQLDSQLYSQLDSQLRLQLRSQLYSQLYSQLGSQLRSQLGSQLRSQLKDINQNWYLGLWWLVWCGWYEYGKTIGVEFTQDAYDLFINFNSEVHFIIPYKKIAFISEKPVEIRWKDGVLHNETGMAVRYSDNYGLWCLSGVNVPKEIVMTPAQDLDPHLIQKETNAEIRREIVRKIGVERVCQKLGAKVLDKQGNYELLSLNLGDNRIRPYLKMLNPSIGVWHIEGVEPRIKTVQEALNWRNQTEEIPDVIS